MSKPHDEHEDWVRYHCFDMARRITPYSKDVEKMIEDAKKIERFVLKLPSSSVIPLKIADRD